jgi:hypothetical protein
VPSATRVFGGCVIWTGVVDGAAIEQHLIHDEEKGNAQMALRIARISALATVAATGVLCIATASAPAYPVYQTNWVVAGSLTPKKLNQQVILPKGSVFNGVAELKWVNPATLEPLTGTLTGTVTVPTFQTTITILGVPTNVQVTFKQVGAAQGVIASVPRSTCSETVYVCMTLNIPTQANLGITAVGAFGVNLLPTHCQTAEPVTFPLSTTLDMYELLSVGPRFAGETSIPPIACYGPEALVLGPALTQLMSGPENPYALSINAPPRA